MRCPNCGFGFLVPVGKRMLLCPNCGLGVQVLTRTVMPSFSERKQPDPPPQQVTPGTNVVVKKQGRWGKLFTDIGIAVGEAFGNRQ